VHPEERRDEKRRWFTEPSKEEKARYARTRRKIILLASAPAKKKDREGRGRCPENTGAISGKWKAAKLERAKRRKHRRHCERVLTTLWEKELDHLQRKRESHKEKSARQWGNRPRRVVAFKPSEHQGKKNDGKETKGTPIASKQMDKQPKLRQHGNRKGTKIRVERRLPQEHSPGGNR